MVLESFLSYSKLCTVVKTPVYQLQLHCSAVNAAHIFEKLQYFWKAHLITSEKVFSQKQGDSREETIQNLSALAGTDALKYHFSKKLQEKNVNKLSDCPDRKEKMGFISLYGICVSDVICCMSGSAFGKIQ